MVVRAVFENGQFRPLDPVHDIAERSEVLLTITKPTNRKALRAFRGTLSKQDADQMQRVIQEGRRVEGDW
jgi:predicted DNA-binding antitoxin AbrB/MazE fold protein